MLNRKNKFETIDEYIQTFPKNVQKILEEVRQTIKKTAPAAQEAISYQMPTFKLNGNLVHFAAFKNHIGFYPTPTGAEKFKTALSNYKTGKGSVQFPLHEPMPLLLIKKIIEYRVKENIKRIKKNK